MSAVEGLNFVRDLLAMLRLLLRPMPRSMQVERLARLLISERRCHMVMPIQGVENF
jgi:hypothetical protein